MPNENKFTFVPFASDFKVDVDTSEIKAVTESIDLTEENCSVLTTVFEGAVNAKVSEIAEACEAHYLEQAEEQLDEHSTYLSSHISGFLEKALNEWFEENLETIDESIKVEINSDLVGGLVELLKESYFEIPADRKDLVETMSQDLKTQEEEITDLEEQVEKLTNGLKGKSCEDIVSDLSEGLTDTQAEKLVTLIEDFDIDDVEVFGKKARIMRESLFGKIEESAEETDDDAEETTLEEETSTAEDSELTYADKVMLRSAEIT